VVFEFFIEDRLYLR